MFESCGHRSTAFCSSRAASGVEANRTYRGFSLFDAEDLRLFEVLLRGAFNISGFRNHTLRTLLTSKTAPQLSRILKRLRCHGLIKKVAGDYKYHLTILGRAVASLAQLSLAKS